MNKLKKYKPVEDSKEEGSLYNWYVDSIVIERKSYFLFTNSLTLFSFFLYAGTKKEYQKIESIFEEKLEELIIKEIGTLDNYLEKVLPQGRSYRFCKTNSRSILGSMSDFKTQIEAHLWTSEWNPSKHNLIHHHLNKCPMSALKNDWPVERMKIELGVSL